MTHYLMMSHTFFFFFFFNDTATTEIYTLSLHDALPIFEFLIAPGRLAQEYTDANARKVGDIMTSSVVSVAPRSEEHTSELQSRRDLVCRLLLEKKKTNKSASSSK